MLRIRWSGSWLRSNAGVIILNDDVILLCSINYRNDISVNFTV